MLRLLVLGVAAWTAGAVGFASLRPELGAALVWPLTGVALVWAATGSRRTWPVDALLLFLVATASVLVAGSTWGQAAMGGVQTVVQAAVYLLVVRRLAPHLWSAGGRQPMTRLADLGVLLVAVAAAALVATLVRATGLGMIPVPQWSDNALVWMRNFCGMFTIGAAALLVGPLLSRDLRWQELRRRSGEWWGRWPARSPEIALVATASIALYAAVFWQQGLLPVSFVLLLPPLWVGLRTSPVVATGLALLLGVVALGLTLQSRGIFAAVADPRIGALLAQGFVVTTITVSLAISLVSGERLRASAQARASERRSADRATLLSAVLEQIREGIMVVRADGTLAMHNPALADLPDAAGSRWTEAGELRAGPPLHDLQGRLVPTREQPLARALAGEEVVGEHLVVHEPGGAPRTLEVSASPLPGSEDPQVLVVVRDVTSLRRREDDLAAFAGTVAHDLASPLTVITGWVDALDDAFSLGALDAEEGTTYTRRVRDSAVQMRRLIDDLLAYTVARDQPFLAEEVDLSALVEEIASTRRESDRRPEITVQPGMRLHGDRVLLRQLLDNLVGNAVKYVAVGTRPEVTVTGGPGTRPDLVEIRVDDNGVGVPETHRSLIFETFVRAHGSEFSGTGLGLDICRKVVERHGGQIRVEDRAGGGSSFVVTLPVGVDQRA